MVPCNRWRWFNIFEGTTFMYAYPTPVLQKNRNFNVGKYDRNTESCSKLSDGSFIPKTISPRCLLGSQFVVCESCL